MEKIIRCLSYCYLAILLLLIMVPHVFANTSSLNPSLDTTKNDDINTIVVNADKFPEKQQEIAASTTVINTKELERAGIDSTIEFVQRVPNVYMIQTGNGTSSGWLSMRGITPYMGGESTVGYFIDGIYSSSINLKLLDTSAIEILRGPQSTLYGRNTEAGVINIQTMEPLPITEGKVQASYGNYNTSVLNSLFGGALSDSKDWSYRAAFRLGYTDGYFVRPEDDNKRIDNHKDLAGRLKLRWYTSDSPWDITTTLFTQHTRGNNTGIVALSQINKKPRRIHSNYEGDMKDGVDSASINAIYEADQYTLTSLSSYSKTHAIESNDIDFTALDTYRLKLDNKYSRFSQELRINSQSASDELNWVAGFYFFDQTKRSSTIFTMPLWKMTDISSSKLDTLNMATFGQINVPIIEKLKLFSGLRYDYEHKKVSDRPASGNNADEKLSFNAWLPKVGINYSIFDNIMSYFSISRGYKSGGFNTLIAPGDKKYDPEYTINYEWGLKSELFDGKLRNNLALFWIDWKDQQIEQAIYPQTVVQNVGKSVSKGIEWEMNWQPIDYLTFRSSLGYTDSYFKTYTDTLYNSTGAVIGTKNYKNKRIPNTPNFTYTFGIDYSFYDDFYVRSDWLGTGKVYYDLDNKHKQNNYGILNAKGGYDDKHYAVSIWINNVTNEHYLTRAFDMQGTWVGRIGEPRTFGVTAGVKW